MQSSSAFHPQDQGRVEFPDFPCKRMGIKNPFLNTSVSSCKGRGYQIFSEYDLFLFSHLAWVRIVKWFWAVLKEKSTHLWHAASTNPLWTCDLEWVMNGVSCRTLFPRKQTLELLQLDLQKQCLLPLPPPTFLVIHGPRSPFPSPHSRHTLGWTLGRHELQTIPNPKEFTISVFKKWTKDDAKDAGTHAWRPRVCQ